MSGSISGAAPTARARPWSTRSAIPTACAAIVLDGAAPFEIALPLYNAWGAQRALDRLLADCAAERECRSAYPRLREELDEVFARLPVRASLRHPRTGKPLEMTVSRGGFASGLRGMLYTPAHASLIPWVIHSAPARGFRAVRHAEPGDGRMVHRDDEPRPHPLGALLGGRAPHPRRRGGARGARHVPRGFRDRGLAADVRALAARSAARRVDRSGRCVPALILSGDLDPVTPPRWGEAMKNHFPGALHVVVPGTGAQHLHDRLRAGPDRPISSRRGTDRLDLMRAARSAGRLS